ncbi:MAG: MurR/RpiR family transcriptional regulator [Pseudomonadota bacterium]
MVMSRINTHFNTLSDELKRAARWIMDHPAEACFLSMREQARRAEVVAPTMMRLAKALGFASFPALQESLRGVTSWGNADYSDHAKKLQAAAQETAEHLNALESLQRNNLNTLHLLNSAESFARIASLLLNARFTAYLGLRSSHSVALHAHYLHQLLVGRAVLLDNHYGMLTEAVDELEPGTVLIIIGIAPYSRETVEIAQRAAEQGATLIALTDSILSPLAQISQETLLFHAASNSFFHSLVAAHALIERMMAEVAVQGGEAVVNHIHKRETALQKSNTYWLKTRSTAPRQKKSTKEK